MNHWQIVMLLAVYAFSCLVDAENQQQCINDIVDWCNKQVYNNDVIYYWKNSELVNGQTVELQCTIRSDYPGTNCFKNGGIYAWFSCDQGDISTYKDKRLTKNSLNGADSEICYAASKITRLPTTERDRQKCVNDLVDWCNNQDYTNAILFQWTITETVNGVTAEIKCISNDKGISCERTSEIGGIWFLCTSNHLVIFRGAELVKNSNDAANADICLGQSIITMIPTTTATNEEQTCVNDIVDWCNKQDYTNVGFSVWTFSETVNGQTVSIKCKSDTSGTKCTKSGFVGDWFSCSSNHLTTYKGITLVENSPTGKDDEICYAASKISAIVVYRTTGTTTLTAKEKNDISGFGGIGTFVKSALKP